MTHSHASIVAFVSLVCNTLLIFTSAKKVDCKVAITHLRLKLANKSTLASSNYNEFDNC